MAHRFETVVRFAELDPYDHVNHARYLSYFESARVELLDEMGYGMTAMAADGVHIVLVELTASFHQPARLHDRLTIVTRVGDVARTTTRWHQECSRGEDLVVTLDVRAAFTDPAGRPRRAPDGFSEAAARYR